MTLRGALNQEKNANIHFFFQIFPLLRPKDNKVLKPLAEYFMEGHLLFRGGSPAKSRCGESRPVNV